MLVILRDMIHHAGLAAMQVAAAQILGADDLSRRRLHQRRPGKEDRPLIAHDHRLVRHCGHIGPTRRTTAHDAGDLGNASRRHLRLIVEDAPKMLPVGKYFGLIGEVRTAAIYQINAGQPVFERDFLRAQMLLHRQRIVSAALHRRIVADDHHLPSLNATDTRYQASARHLAMIHVIGRELPDLQKRTAGVQQPLHPFAGQQLAAPDMLVPRLGRSTDCRSGNLRPQLLHQRQIMGSIGAKPIRLR